jgi:hypothetical protein
LWFEAEGCIELFVRVYEIECLCWGEEEGVLLKDQAFPYKYLRQGVAASLADVSGDALN